MSTQVQWKRGTTAQNNTYTGAIGEIVVDTTLKQLRLHDGVTQGGTTIGSTAVTVSTATNIAGGTAGQVPYQTAGGATSFYGPGTAGQILLSNGAAAPVYTNTASIYVGASLYSNTATNLLGGTPGQLHYQTASGATSFVNTGSQGNILVSQPGAPVYTNTSTFLIGYANNIAGGTPGQLVYQASVSGTGFVGPGTAGQLLVSNGTSGPAYTNTTSIYVGRAAQSDILTPANTSTQQVGYSANILGGAAGSLPYQTAGNTTAMLPIGTSGYILAVSGSAPAWTPLSGLSAGLATTATNIAGGTAGQVPYQTAAGATSFYGPGTAGQLLVSNGAAAPVYTSTGSIYVGRAAQADILTPANTSTQQVGYAANLLGGAAGNIHYQTAPNTSGFAANIAYSAAGTASYTQATGQTLVVSSNGLGVTGNSYFANNVGVGGTLYLTGDLYVDGTQFIVNTQAIATGDKALVLSTGSTTALLSSGSGLYVGASSSTAYSSFYYDGVNGWIAAGTTGGSLMLGGATAPVSGAKLTVTGGANFTTIVTATTFVGGLTGTATQANNLNGGTTGSMPIQSANGTTAFIPLGTPGYVLTAGASTASWAALSGLSAGNATTATNLAGGTAGQVPYQSAAGATSFYGPGTAGQILVSNGAAAPVYTSTGSIYVNRATLADAATTSTNAGTSYATIGTLSTGTGFYGASFNGSANQTWSLNTTTLMTTAVNIAGGTAGQLHYQSAANTTAFVGAGSYGQFLMSTGANAPVYQSTITQVNGNIVIAGTTSTNSTATGSLQVAGGIGVNGGGYFSGIVTATTFVGNLTGTATFATTSTNLAGGVNGSIPYQTAAGVTTMLGIGTNGYVITSNGTTPIWSAVSGLSAGSATTATNLAGGTAGQIPYQNAVGSTLFTGPGSYGQFLMSTGANAPVYQSTLTQTNGNIIINSVTSATSTTTGALQVAGGVGIGGSLYVNNIYSSANAFSLSLQSGPATPINITAGNGSPVTSSGVVNITGGTGNGLGSPGGSVIVTGGASTGAASTGGSVILSGGTGAISNGSVIVSTASQLLVYNIASTTSTATGAVVINGGLGVGGGAVFGGTVTATNMILNGYQVSTSSALIIQGYGSLLGPAGTLNFSTGTTATVVNGVATIQALGSVTGITAGTDTAIASVSGAVTIWNTSTLQSITNRGATSTNAISITNTTAATSTLTGALLVTGGFGLGGNFYSAGIHVIQNSTQATSTTTGALQIVNGGMGVGGNAYIGGNLYTNGAQVLPTSIQEFTATGGQTTFTVAGGYTVGTVQLFANGIGLGATDFTASNGTSVTLNTPRNAGDIIRTVSGLTSSSINNITARTLAYAVVFG